MTEPMNPAEIAAMVADTSTDYRKAMLYHSDRADAFMAERDELAAAIDSIETSNGLTINGNLWRFWSQKARDVAAKNTALSTQLAAMTAERDAAVAVARVLKAAGEEYILEHVMETDWHRQGRHSAVRGMIVRLDLYSQLEAAIDCAITEGTPT